MAITSVSTKEVQQIAKRRGWDIATIAAIAKVSERQARRWLKGESGITEGPLARLRNAAQVAT